ncbi:MAG TPA: (Fe-S)-binding protein, partial [Gammaproteobacteria bacterium]|nr:(Fe-S)-binding protein [Gammaproteobacteria bacterium]
DALHDARAEILVTSNIGCALHLQAGLRERGRDIEVLHPLTLLARQVGG